VRKTWSPTFLVQSSKGGRASPDPYSCSR
jgi:hypothetical protein